MTRATTFTILAVMMVSAAHAQPPAPAAAELTALLTEFLDGASRNDAAVHERFWADDLVYTRAVGQRLGKAEILRDVRSAPKPGDQATAYTAEDVRIRQYGDTATVAFRLVGTTGAGAQPAVETYLNTGTFVKRNGRWQAVAWQATREAAREAREATAAPEKADGGGMGEFFLVLLKKGPAWTAERNDRTKAIQEGHMANIKAMWEAKKLVVAGPMGDDGDTRGVFVFKTANRDEAAALTAADPAVKAGRLVPEIHSWWVEKRALPEAGAYCRP